MSITILFPSNTTEITDAIRGAIGRSVSIYYTVCGIACPVCSLDPVTNLSVDQFCLTCGGEYWLNSVSGITITGRVLHKGMDTLLWQTGGKMYAGDAQIRVKYNSRNDAAVKASEYFVVDGKKFILKEFEYRGVPDINRIVVTLEQIEKEG